MLATQLLLVASTLQHEVHVAHFRRTAEDAGFGDFHGRGAKKGLPSEFTDVPTHGRGPTLLSLKTLQRSLWPSSGPEAALSG